jgi:hypothetical protein
MNSGWCRMQALKFAALPSVVLFPLGEDWLIRIGQVI